MSRSFLVFSLLLLLSGLASPVQAVERSLVRIYTDDGRPLDLYRESYALVIGNGDYTEPGWDRLPGALQDVDEVAEVLERNGFEVFLHKNLTSNEFRDVLLQFSMKSGQKPDSRLLLYYSGHGYTLDMANGDKLGFLVMVDAPDPVRDPVGFRRASVSMDFLVTEAKQIKSRHVLFLFDSCFSGTILNMKGHNQPEFITDLTRYPVREFLTAGREDEPVPDRSVFKQLFVDVLDGRIKEPIEDGYLTGEELGLLMKTDVPGYNRNQHPQFGKINDPKLDKGDFVFVLPGGPRPSPPASPHASAGASYSQREELDEIEQEKKKIQEEKERLAEERERLAKMEEDVARERERQKIDEEKRQLAALRRELDERKEQLQKRDEPKVAADSFEASLPPAGPNEQIRVFRVEKVDDTGVVFYFYYNAAQNLSMDLNSRSATDQTMNRGRRIISGAYLDNSLVAVYYQNKVSRTTGLPYELLTRIVSEKHGSLEIQRKYKIY